MAYHKQKTSAILAGTMLILSQVLATVPMVSAQSTANATTKCDEGVHPFDPTKTELTGSTADSLAINFPGESHCNSSLTGSMPWNQHEDPDPATHNPKSTSYTVPKALHEHHYINESVSSDGYYKRAWMRTFKINLQSDLKSVKVAHSLKCPIPDDGAHFDSNFANCDAGSLPFHYENPKVFGGTSLDYDGTSLVYTFGLHQPVNDGGTWYVKPLIPGKNDSGEMPGSSGSWTSRAFGMAIDFETKNMSPDTAWSGTSTSQAEVIHTAIPKSAFNAVPGGLASTEANKGKYHACTEGGVWNASNSWCAVGGYQWANVATVATVWKPAAVPPPPECTGLTVNPSALNPSGSTAMTAKVTISDGSVHTATIKWAPVGGTMSAGNTQTGSSASTFNNTFNLTDPSGTVEVWVDSLVGATNTPACSAHKQVKTPPSPPTCTNLTVTPATLNASGTTPMTAKITISDGSVHTATVKWAPSGGIMSAGTTQTGSTASNFNNTFTLVGSSGSVDVWVDSLVGALNSPACSNHKSVKTPPRPYCKEIVPNKLTLSNTGSDTWSAKVNYSDGIDRSTEVTWTPVNLTLTPATNPENHSSATNFVKITNPITSGSPVSLNAKVTGVPADVDNSPACSAGVTASSGGDNLCQNLNNSGYTGTTVAGGTSVLLAPNPTNTAAPHPAQVTWTESGAGVLIRNPASPFPFNLDANCPAVINDTTVSLPRGCQYFYSTPSTVGASGSVTITANPNNGNVAACTQTTSFNNPPDNNNFCTGLNWTSQPNGQICVSPIGTFNGQYQWTIGSTTFTNGACQNVPPNTSVHVEGIGAPQCQVNIPPQSSPCNYITPSYNNGQLCVNPNPSSYTGPFTWKIGNGVPFTNGVCQNVAPNTLVTVTGPTAACSLSNYLTPPNPPRFVKTVRAVNPPESSQGERGGSVALTLVPNIENKVVQYKLVFTPTSPFTTATIVDDISKGYIQGKTNTGSDGGRIVYNDNMSVSVPPCTNTLKAGCYSGDIGSAAGITLVKVSNEVTITYLGKVVGSKLTEENCQDNNSMICQEKYPNNARVDFQVYDSPAEDAHLILTGAPLNANALVQSFCQYILTRAAGDIYLETDLNFGKDIYLCSEYKSSTGLIVTPGPPAPPQAPSTGPSTTVPIGHEVCSQGLTLSQNGQNTKLYGDNAASQKLSSQICEVKLRPGESWSKSTITSTIKENKTRVSRWEPNLNAYGSTITSFDDASLPASSTGVYHKSNGSLTLGTGSDILLNDGQGAKTFIVENGDLIIKNNIRYGECAQPVCTVRDTASLAFIVLNGNVYIDPSVTEVSGVFFVQQGDNAESGRIKALGSGDAFTKVTIYGSVYGDIQDLFTHRKFAGDPAANEGSVVIRFDERIILNTPPGLKDILQLSQNEVAR
ncbi:MAG: hypothetical protein U0519_04250 [Candidatus Gracilibacteria bacterium]